MPRDVTRAVTVEDAVDRSTEIANRITLGGYARAVLFGLVTVLAACTQGPGGGGIGLGSGQAPDPATVDFPIFYIRHQVPEDQDDVTRLRPYVKNDANDTADMLYSATLWKRDRASPGAAEKELTARLRVDPVGKADDRYDIKDLAVSPDGLKVAFAMRGPLKRNLKEEDPPTWNIWEYDIATDDLHRVIKSDIVAEDGQDVAPAYLPDGRILFSSTRQRQSKAVLLDENKEQFEATNESRNESAFVLHVMNGDGTNLQQLSFNNSSDMYGTVLQSGRILYTRWDHGMGDQGLHLYSMNPDGTDAQLYYGALSHATGTPKSMDPAVPSPDVEFMRPREMSDGRIMVLTRERTDVDFGGSLTIIDGKNYVENTQALAGGTGTGPAQTPATLNDVRTIPGPSPGGRFESGFPLWDGSGRILVSWSQCRLLDVHGTDPTRIIPCDATSLADPQVQTAKPLYSIWMFTPSQNTILPVMAPVEGVMVTEAIAAQPRTPLPSVILPAPTNPDWVAEGVGVLSIKSVYDIMGQDKARTTTAASTIGAVSDPANAAYANRLVRFIRIEKLVSQPDDNDVADPDNSAFGPAGQMREIVAYAPVEPDGSVYMKVPANIPFQMSLLDANGRRVVPRHGAWLSLRPGELLECNGCHTRTVAQGQTVMSHGRRGSFNAAYNGSAAGGAFPNTPTTIFAEVGDTMAKARARTTSTCPSDPSNPTGTEHCGRIALNPSADVVYDEIWKKSPLVTDSYIFSHQSLSTPRPTNASCYPWQTTCRITIHYATIGTPPRAGHIHPLWSFVRSTLLLPNAPPGIDTNGDGVLEPTYTCTSCHSRTDVAGKVQLPAASLELTDEVSDEDALQLKAYRQMLFQRPELILQNGVVTVHLVSQNPPVFDTAGNEILVPATLPAPMSAGNAVGSRFFNVMNNARHRDMLTPAELRLLSEWLDIGAQYYNDPFPPTPQN